MERGYTLPGYARFKGNRDGILHMDLREFFAGHFGFSDFSAAGYRGIFRCLLRGGP